MWYPGLPGDAKAWCIWRTKIVVVVGLILELDTPDQDQQSLQIIFAISSPAQVVVMRQTRWLVGLV